MSENYYNKMLGDLVKTRVILKEKLKQFKLNQIDRINLLEDKFQPITKPLKKSSENLKINIRICVRLWTVCQ